jgi:predicted  nucleic acid-binding Zn-ribbon protein
MADINIIVAAQTEDARRQLAQLQQQVKNTSNQFGKAKGVHNQYGKQVDKNTRGLSTFAKSGLQQTGYQVGDLIVQLEGGTSFLRAFGQQGSQLLGIFGPFGAIAGAAVAAVAALSGVFLSARESTKSFSEELGDLNTLITTANGITGTASERYERLRKKYGTVTETVKKLANAEVALVKIRLEKAFLKTRDALTKMGDRFVQTNREIDELKSGAIGFNTQSVTLANDIVRLSNEFGIMPEAVKKLGVAFKEFGELENASDASKKAAEILQLLKGSETEAARLSVLKLKEALVEMGLSTAELERILEVMNENGGVIAATTIATNRLGEAFGASVKEADALGQSISGSIGAGFKDIIKGTSSVEDAFRKMAANIIDQLIDVLVIQRLVGNVAGADGTGGTGIAGFFTNKRAIGGPVTTGQTYLVGEKGPELFTAGSNGRIIPNNQMQGGGTTVVQNINISTGVSQTVRAEIAQLMPQIANSAKAAVLDAKQRGGTFSKAF